ncbi:MAG: sulfatase-like hydrolase/transferase [Phycisphaeraceae bacterium]|nr:sulfatase-like hydrolase/transferase [Phycisphaeraceae bacterium]
MEEMKWVHVGVVVGILSCGAWAASSKTRPNILYIFTDDQSIRTVSCYPQAQPWAHTPNIDKLAAQGVRFSYCYTGAKCVPSRGNALTGKLQFNYTKDTAYWPVAFRKQGYFTGMIGKWHWNVPRHEETWDWSAVWEHHLPKNSRNYYWDQELRMNGDTLQPIGYSTDSYTDLTIEFIRDRAKQKGEPWFFWLCYGAVHGPYTPAERHEQLYLDKPKTEIPADVFGPRPDKPEHMVNMSMWKKDKKTGKPVYGKKSLDAWVKQYNQAVQSIDEGVGRIMAALRDTGQLDNTIVIFTSDQGYAWGQHGYKLKIGPYDACLLAPMIVVNQAAFPAGQVCDEPVNGTDIISAIHSLAKVTPSSSLDGRDISELFGHPQKADWHTEPMIQTYTGNLYGDEAITEAIKVARKTGHWNKLICDKKTGTPSWLMLRQAQYKYIRYMQPDTQEELYDLTKDPDELANLAVKKDHHNLLADLRRATEKAFKAKGASFIDLLPEPEVISK